MDSKIYSTGTIICLFLQDDKTKQKERQRPHRLEQQIMAFGCKLNIRPITYTRQIEG